MASTRAKHRAPRRAFRSSTGPVKSAPLAATATFAVVGIGVAVNPAPASVELGQATVIESPNVAPPAKESTGVSRSGVRGDIAARAEQQEREAKQATRRQQREARKTAQAVSQADTRLWTTADLNIWTAPGNQADQLGLLDEERRVLVTGRAEAGREEIVLRGESRWVTAGYLTEQRPEEEPADEPAGNRGVDGECTNGTTIARPVSPNLEKVYQAVCANFPEITTYGTLRSDGEHGQGLAVDIMVSGDRGWQVAEFVKANASELGVNYAIFSRNIWSVQRSSEGWRAMEDRGSVTANHEDHVHVTTY